MRMLFALLLVLMSAGPAEAQRGRPGGGTRASETSASDQTTRRFTGADRDRLDDDAARRAAAQGYDAEDVLAAYDRDGAGRWFRRGEIVIASADARVFAAAARFGLTERRSARLAAAGVDAVTYVAPVNTNMEGAVAVLREAFPDAAIDLNYIYVAQGQPAAQPQIGAPAAAAQAPVIAAIIDGAIRSAPCDAELTTRRFAEGATAASGHADAVAAILCRAANVSALKLFAADVVSAGPIRSAAADDIARALDWAAFEGAGVVNVSLTGPPSMTVALVVRAVTARGSIVVAAAGNDGPRARAPFPAALPEVVGVTAVDDRGRIWRRATHGAHVDFAARGVRVGGGLTGTSFAAPVVAGLLARRLGRADPRLAPLALRDLELSARDRGATGRDPVYGAGIVEATQEE